jgi:serine protease Do
MEKIKLTFLSGYDVNKAYSFDKSTGPDISLGRDPRSQIPVNDMEDVVSRSHARIFVQPDGEWAVEDLSANGVYVNDKKVDKQHPLSHEDKLRLGLNGPSLIVEISPPPGKNTRLEVPAAGKHTRIEPTDTSTTPRETKVPAEVVTKVGIGKETLERKIVEATSEVQSTSNKRLLNVSVFAMALLVAMAGVGYYVFTKQSKNIETLAVQANQKVAPAFDAGFASSIRDNWGKSTVYIEASWKLVHGQTGQLIYHRAMKIDGKTYPVYIRNPNNPEFIEPALTLTPNDYAIGGAHSGSGFVVSKVGHIMTNRHVASAWNTQYNLLFPGVLLDGKGRPQRIVNQLPPGQQGWVPSKALFLGNKGIADNNLIGQNQVLNVVFPNSKLRIPASLGTISPEHDVALIKIESAVELQPLMMRQNAAQRVKPGNKVVLLGYPGISAQSYVVTKSQDVFQGAADITLIKDVSVNEGIVSKIVPGKTANSEDERYVAIRGDSIEVNISSSGQGNSGGPLFDSEGQVIGIFAAGTGNNLGILTWAVPISYGLDLLDPTRSAIAR